MTTTLQELLSTLLDYPLADWVSARRRQGESWDAIAADLTSETGREVYGESLRRWFA